MDSSRIQAFFWVFIVGIFISLPEHTACAQTADSTSQPSSQVTSRERFINPHEFMVWVGLAFDSFALWGKTPDTRNQSLGIGYNRKLGIIHNIIIEYNMRIDLYSNYSYPDFDSNGQRSSLSGLGLSPLGFQLNFLSSQNVQPFINTSAGVIFLENPFPDFRGSKLNFTLSAGGGVEIRLSGSVSLSAGIKYHHLSNGGRGQVNPGVDSTIYYTAITFF
jgi:opacity protein-like surface antigen